MEARPVAAADGAARRTRQPRHRRSRAVSPGPGGRRRGRARPRAGAPGRPRRRRARGAARRRPRRPPPVDGHPGVRPLARRRGDRGLEDVREGGHGRRGRAHRGDARRADRALRAQGRRPRRGQGRRRLPHAGGGRGRARRARRARRPARRRGAARRPRGVGVRALRRRHRARAPGRAGLQARRGRRPGPEHRRDGVVRPGSRLRRRRGRGARRPHLPPGPGRARGARPPVRRDAVRGADADAGRPAGARVQLPLRRSRDAVAAAARRRRPARSARRALRPATSATFELGRRAGAAVTVVLAAGDYPASGDRGSPITGIEAAEATGALVFHAGHGPARRQRW